MLRNARTVKSQHIENSRWSVAALIVEDILHGDTIIINKTLIPISTTRSIKILIMAATINNILMILFKIAAIILITHIFILDVVTIPVVTAPVDLQIRIITHMEIETLTYITLMSTCPGISEYAYFGTGQTGQ